MRTYDGGALTSRQLQAIKTKQNIYDTVMKLGDIKGFSNLKVTEICKQAHISPGTFYYYYPSVDAIFQETYRAYDDYVKEEMRSIDPDLPVFDKILELYRLKYKYIEKHGVQLIVRQYTGLFSQIDGSNMVFYSKKRIMYKTLVSLISEGQKTGVIKKDDSPSQIANALMIYSRGITIDWALHNGSYDIVSGAMNYMTLILKEFFIKA